MVVDLSGEAKTRPCVDRCPLAGWGILQGLTDWDLCSLFTAAVRSSDSLAECDVPLEPLEAAESDGNQQLDPLLTDDAPETTISFLLFVCQWKSSCHLTCPDQIRLPGQTYKMKRNLNPNLMEGRSSVSQQVGSRGSPNFGCSEQLEASGGWSAEVTRSCLLVFLRHIMGHIQFTHVLQIKVFFSLHRHTQNNHYNPLTETYRGLSMSYIKHNRSCLYKDTEGNCRLYLDSEQV